MREGICKDTGLYRIPLKKLVKNVNTYTILIDRTDPKNAINNVSGIAIAQEIIQYIHACAGFPTTEKWLKGIRSRNYDTWTGLTAKSVSKQFPESNETQNGHMIQATQGVIPIK